MPRPERIALGGYVYHVLNRANGRLRIFRKQGDFVAFEKILGEAMPMFAMRLCGYCIMGNHWHLLLWPGADGALPAFMRWVTLTHVQRYHASHATTGIGHLYQGRYKSFPVQGDRHFLRVLRYIEANPLRAGLVDSPEQWPWSSYAVRAGRRSNVTLAEGPVELPPDWNDLIREALEPEEAQAIDNSLRRGSPLGDTHWTAATVQRLALQSTLRPRGRPRKST